MAGDSLTGANNVGMAGILVALVIFVPTVVRLAKQEST
jgi:hypothetical protein